MFTALRRWAVPGPFPFSLLSLHIHRVFEPVFFLCALGAVPKPHVPNQVPGDAPDAFEILSNPDQGRFVQFLQERHLHGLLRLAGLFHCQFIGLLLDLVHDSVLMPGILVLGRVAEDCHGIRQIQQHLGLLVLQRFVLHRQQDIFPHQIFPRFFQDLRRRESQQFPGIALLLPAQLVVQLLVCRRLLFLGDHREIVVKRHEAQRPSVVPFHEESGLVIHADHCPAKARGHSPFIIAKAVQLDSCPHGVLFLYHLDPFRVHLYFASSLRCFECEPVRRAQFIAPDKHGGLDHHEVPGRHEVGVGQLRDCYCPAACDDVPGQHIADIGHPVQAARFGGCDVDLVGPDMVLGLKPQPGVCGQ